MVGVFFKKSLFYSIEYLKAKSFVFLSQFEPRILGPVLKKGKLSFYFGKPEILLEIDFGLI
jgi:hypothetical protein